MKVLTKPVFWMLLLSNALFSQVFIAVDTDTHEFVENVNFSLYKNKKAIYEGITFNDRVTKIDKNLDYDSIIFSRSDYQVLRLAKRSIDSVIYLSKSIIYLDELVVNSKTNKQIVIGESNRFVKSGSRPLSNELSYGSVFKNVSKDKIALEKILFFVDKVVIKTAYKVNLVEVVENTYHPGYRVAELGRVIYSSELLYLNPKDKKAAVAIATSLYLQVDKPIFIWIQLLGYYDREGKELNPNVDAATTLRFQLSDYENFYSRYWDANTKQLTSELINNNIRIKYDFANQLFTKPHKSILLTPAITLYGSKAE